MDLYFDHNATTPLNDAAKQSYVDALGLYGNPSSVHSFGRDSRMAIDGARRKVAQTFGVRAEQVVFTGGGSEANNLVLKGFTGKHYGVSPTEHASVRVTAKNLAEQNTKQVTWLKVDKSGVVDLSHLEAVLKDGHIDLVSVMAAHNETGVIQPFAEIGTLCQQYNTRYHVDAIQAAGKLPLQFTDTGADFMTLSAHKFGGPKGVGILLIKGKPTMHSLIDGGGHERNRRAGTENTPAIAATGAALTELPNRLACQERLRGYQNQIEQAAMGISQQFEVVGKDAKRLANTSCVLFHGIDTEALILSLDMEGVALSSGSACSSGRIAASAALLAQGYDDEQAKAAVRISTGPETTDEAVTLFAQKLQTICHRLLAT